MILSATSLPNCTMMKPASLSAASVSRPQTGISRMSKIAMRDLVQHRLDERADDHRFARQPARRLIARRDLVDLGDVFVADRHRPAGLVRPPLGVALVDLHQELARQPQRRQEQPQLLEHLPAHQPLADRAELRVLRLGVGDVDLGIAPVRAGAAAGVVARRRRRRRRDVGAGRTEHLSGAGRRGLPVAGAGVPPWLGLKSAAR